MHCGVRTRQCLWERRWIMDSTSYSYRIRWLNSICVLSSQSKIIIGKRKVVWPWPYRPYRLLRPCSSCLDVQCGPLIEELNSILLTDFIRLTLQELFTQDTTWRLSYPSSEWVQYCSLNFAQDAILGHIEIRIVKGKQCPQFTGPTHSQEEGPGVCCLCTSSEIMYYHTCSIYLLQPWHKKHILSLYSPCSLDQQWSLKFYSPIPFSTWCFWCVRSQNRQLPLPLFTKGKTYCMVTNRA